MKLLALAERSGEELSDLWSGHWCPKPQALAWVRRIRDDCVAAGVPFFFKQWGGPRPTSGGRLLDGKTWDEMPVVTTSTSDTRSTRRLDTGVIR